MSLRELLCPPGHLVTAIIDGALLPDLPQKLFITPPSLAHCLLGDEQEPAVLRTAPWFAAFAPSSDFAAWLSIRMAESPCGIAAVVGDITVQPSLYDALRPLVLIADAAGAPLILRWWDSRVRADMAPAAEEPLVAELEALLPGALYAEPPLPLTFRSL
jgi:hypothetical protein